MIMKFNRQHFNMMHEAHKKHGDIHLCGAEKNFLDCFTVIEGDLYFWYNDDKGSTHAIRQPLRTTKESWWERVEDWFDELLMKLGK